MLRSLLAPALVVIFSLLLAACGPDTTVDANPPADGFNLAGSDPQAIAIADATMAAMGGRAAWDNTRHITWRFFGGRRHVWDKFTNNLRYENGDTTVLMNLDTEQGRAWKAGEEVTDADALKEILHGAKGAWINDSYWLVMPYKLKDSGVTLTYVGKQPNSAGRPSDVLQLTFSGVGRTPQNKYHVFVDQETQLVTEWTYWPDATKDDPRPLGVWENWQPHGDILLSDSRGQRGHSEVAVFAELPASVYTEPTPAFVLPSPTP